MSLLLSSTLANPTTPYYALAGAGGSGVSALTAGSNVVLTPSSGVGSVQVSLSNVLTTSSTAPTTITSAWGDPPYPTTIAGGQYTGTTYNPINTGTHLVEVKLGFNVDAGAGKAVVNSTAQEFVTVGLVNSANVLVASINTFPVPMAASGNDYGLSATFTAQLVNTLSYQITRFATDSGTNLSLGAANSAVSATIIPLC